MNIKVMEQLWYHSEKVLRKPNGKEAESVINSYREEEREEKPSMFMPQS